MSPTPLQRGSTVRHATRPEWGLGAVERAEPVTIDGVSGQRVAVRFSRAGLKTLMTTHAALEPADDLAPAPTTRDDAAACLPGIPAHATDPFASHGDRLRRILWLYRFTEEPASLQDWAAAQTGLADPLELLARHDLEQGWARYRQARDDALSSLLQELRRTPGSTPPDLAEIIREAPVDGQRALQRIHASR